MLLRSAQINMITEATIGSGLARNGFTPARQRAWVRPVNRDAKQLVELAPLKGAQLAPRWGFSLDYVPHVVGGRTLRWHRTAAVAQFDLVYDPLDYYDPLDHEGRGADRLVSTLRSETEFRRDCNALVTPLLEAVTSFADPPVSDTEVLAQFEAKKRRPFRRFGFRNYPQDMLAYAFVLARVGDSDRASRALQDYLERSDVDKKLEGRLTRLLAETNRASN